MVRVICAACALLLAACGSPQTQKTEVDTPFSIDSATVFVSHPDYDDECDDVATDSSGWPLTKLISQKEFLKPGWIIPDTFSCDSVLANLFPGNVHYCQETIISWKCDDCRKRTFPDAIEGETIIFPRDEGNETRFLDTISWMQPDGTHYLLFCFSSSGPTTDFLRVGRFSKGNLGLALFRRTGGAWKLQAFDASVTASGNFQTADHPTVYVTGVSSFLVLVPDHMNWAGGPSEMMMTLFAVAGSRFYPVSEKLTWGVGNSATQWESEIFSADPQSSSRFPRLIISAGGELIADNNGRISEEFMVPEAAPWFKLKDAFRFTRVQHLEYNDGKYVVTKTEFAADTTWVPE